MKDSGAEIVIFRDFVDVYLTCCFQGRFHSPAVGFSLVRPRTPVQRMNRAPLQQ